MPTSAVYPKVLPTLWQAGIAAQSVPLKCVLLDPTVYTYNAAHQFYSDLSGVVGSKSAAFGGKTFGVAGVGALTAAAAVISAVSGNPCTAVAFFFERGGAVTADDILSYNVLGSTFTPNGGDCTVTPAAGGIASI